MKVVLISISVPCIMFIAWVVHIAVCWKWDIKAWYHDSDNDL